MGNVETMRTSSSRHQVGSENLPKSVGCMSGIFHFISTHRGRSRKRLTSGNRKEIKTPLPTPTRPTPPPPPVTECNVAKKTEPRRLSREAPRSPTIQQEIRRKRPPATAAAASPDSPRRSPALLARLMGLEDAPAPPAAAAPADKRRELLWSLEKCDEDLKALRRIIEAARSVEIKSANSKTVSPARAAGRLLETDGDRDSKSECNGEQPSPVSVLDAISSPRYRSKRSSNDKQGTAAAGSRIVKPSRTGVLFAVGDSKKMEVMPRATMEAKERGWWPQKRRGVSRAMAETVEEVWEEGTWEEKWEMGRVVMWVEVDILWDLVEELVAELMGCCRKWSPPPTPSRSCCRKRLRF